MPRPKIERIRFRPPIAVARLGDSPTPLEAFRWVEDKRLFGAQRTTIEPALSLEVSHDGSVEAYLPSQIRFRDQRMIRPVCPFLELEAKVVDCAWVPLTFELIDRAGMDLSQL